MHGQCGLYLTGELGGGAEARGRERDSEQRDARADAGWWWILGLDFERVRRRAIQRDRHGEHLMRFAGRNVDTGEFAAGNNLTERILVRRKNHTLHGGQSAGIERRLIGRMVAVGFAHYGAQMLPVSLE